MQDLLLPGVLIYRAQEAARQGRDTAWFFDEVHRAHEAHRASGASGPLRVLVDLRGAAWGLDASRRTVYARHREVAEHRVAVLGESRIHEFTTNFLVAATGHRTTRYFTEPGRAQAWLMEGMA